MSRAADNKRYVFQRLILIQLMGSKCRYCPERRPWKLEFHHTVKSDWDPAKTSRHRRIRLYARDWAKRECVLACGTCNKKQGMPPYPDEEPIPF
jgi:hypothetical protein